MNIAEFSARRFTLALTCALLCAPAGCDVGDATEDEAVDEPYAYGDPHAIFYKDINLGNTAISSSSSRSYVGDNFNDRMSSLSVPPRREVQLFEHTNYGGRSVTIKYPGEMDLRRHGLNDMVSSFKIREDSDCQLSCDGDTLRFCYTGDTYDCQDSAWYYGDDVTCIELGDGDARCGTP